MQAGLTPLMAAAEKSSTAAVEALLAAGASTDAATFADGRTALMFAADSGCAGSTKALLAFKACAQAQSKPVRRRMGFYSTVFMIQRVVEGSK